MCKKNPAVIFISKIEGDKTTQEGLCIKCAMELNIGPIKDILSKMGVTEDDIDSLNEESASEGAIVKASSLVALSDGGQRSFKVKAAGHKTYS